jgi:hypothetical protein
MSSCSPAGADEDAELGQKGGEQLAVAGAAAEQPGEPWRAEHRPLGSCAEPLRPSFALQNSMRSADLKQLRELWQVSRCASAP